MIVFNPPQVKPYAPATQPVARVAVGMMYDESIGRMIPRFTLLDSTGTRINIDSKGLPQQEITAAQIQAFVAQPTVAGQTMSQDLSSRSLSILATCYGLSGGVVQ